MHSIFQMDTINKRLVAVRERTKMKASAFADALGLGQSRYSKMESSSSIPAGDAMIALAKFLPTLNMNWLLTGEGDMFVDDKVFTPFVAGGEKSVLGSSYVQPGALAAALGPDFGEDEDGKKPSAKVPTDAKGFINLLLAEVDALKAIIKNQDQVILEQREALKESRENAQFLRAQLIAKTEGNHFAPGSEIIPNTVTSPTEIQGLRRYPITTGGVVVAMYPAEQQVLRLAS